MGIKQVTPLNIFNPRVCFECGDPNHFRKACPKLNQTPGYGANNQNQVLAIRGGNANQGNNNSAQGRAFVIGVNEARQDPNIVTSTFPLNNHYATILFDSGADFSFISTKFAPLINIEPSTLNPNIIIEIANGKFIKLNKVICGCTLELEGHPFSIDLVPFELGSFDIVVGMD